MRGRVTRRLDNGVRLDLCDERLVAVGDFNLRDGTNSETGKHEAEAILSSPGKGVVARLRRAQVIEIAGFGMSVCGFEHSKIGSRSVAVYQEWWFVPTGHEDINQ
jgi:hypothetical protein